MTNLFADIPKTLPKELIQRIAGSAAVRIERIVSRGHTSKPDFWYDQPDAEFVLLLAGEARLEFQSDSEPIMLRPGDYHTISPREKHRVSWTSPRTDTIWLAVHF